MCNGGHGGWLPARARRCAASRLVAALALVAGALPAPGTFAAEARARTPRVVWAGEGRVYVAAPDSGAFAGRMLVRVFEKDREIAAGEVAHVLDGVLASVRLTSGRVEPDARFDRLDVRFEPAPVRPVATLRVGLPATGRQSLAPPCAGSRLDLGALPRAYRSEPLADGGVRLVAADSVAAATRWPDTLLVRSFGDRADEEIVLERGELDVAVFWPGEPSARLRASARGFELLRGVRARGLIVARLQPSIGAPTSAGATRIEPNLAALNAELFGGDLLPWRERAGVGPPELAAPGSRPEPFRFAVLGELGRSGAIGRFLNRDTAGVRGRLGLASIDYEDVPLATRDSLEAAGAGGTTIPLFALRCPALCVSSRADDLRELGADAFANLLECLPAGRRP